MYKLKRILSLILSAVMIFSIIFCTGVVSFSEETNVLDYLIYEIINEEVTITDCDKSISGDVVIPSTIEGCPVTTLGDTVFYGCESIKGITIPDSVTTIGDCIFYKCYNLENIEFGSGVTDINNNNFQFCYSLKKITVDKNNEYYCSDENGILFSKDKTVLKKYPALSNETEYTIPDGVTYIDVEAFRYCNKLETVYIPASVSFINSYVFSNCNSLTSIFVDNDNSKYSSDEYGVLFDKYKSVLIQYPIGNTRTEYSISDETIIVKTGAFNNCNSLKSLTIGSGVEYLKDLRITNIESACFENCTALEKIIVSDDNKYFSNDEYGVLYNKDKTKLIQYPMNNKLSAYSIPESVIQIAYYAFSGCTNLKKTIIPTTMSTIGNYAFYDCYSLTEAVIPENVTNIGDSAFYGCVNLESINIPDSVTNMELGAFANCENLRHITIGDGVSSIVFSKVFYNCPAVEEIILGNGITSIQQGDTLFEFSNLKYIKLGENFTEISESMFWNMNNLETVVLSSNVISISSRAFLGCTSLKNINVPDNVESIGELAFLGCVSLESINIPDGVTSIGESAFLGCVSLENINIPDSVISIGVGAFNCTSSLKSITVDENNPVFSSDEYGVLFNKNKTILIQYPAGMSATKYIVPESTTSIQDFAFLDCINLKDVTIHENIIMDVYLDDIGMGLGYIFNNNFDPSNTDTYTKDNLIISDNLKIHGKTNSFAHFYAYANSIHFVATDSEELTTEVPSEEENTTQEPTTEVPPVEESTTQEPTTDEPSTDEPPVEIDKTELVVNADSDIVADEKAKTVIVTEKSDVSTVKNQIENEIQILDSNGNQPEESEFVGTGCRVQLIDSNGYVLSEYTVIVECDIDGNGKVTAADARLALRASAQLENLDGVYSVAADINNDEKITAADARKILRKSASLE